MMRVFASVLTLAAALSLGQPRWALASPDTAASVTRRARELFLEGQGHFGQGKFERALALYEQAYRLRPLPGFVFNMGQCHRYLGRPARALRLFQEYLALRPAAPNKAAVLKLIEICEKELAKTKAPEPPPRVEARPRPTAPAGVTNATSPSRKGPGPAWFWSGAALSAALLATGTITGALALAKNHEYRDPFTPVERRLEVKDEGRRLQTSASVTLGLGAAAAAGTAILYFFTDVRPRSTEVSATSLEGGGVLLSGRGSF